jgi:hypothetical protein
LKRYLELGFLEVHPSKTQIEKLESLLVNVINCFVELIDDFR